MLFYHSPKNKNNGDIIEYAIHNYECILNKLFYFLSKKTETDTWKISFDNPDLLLLN